MQAGGEDGGEMAAAKAAAAAVVGACVSVGTRASVTRVSAL
jgi:hypothetical protein